MDKKDIIIIILGIFAIWFSLAYFINLEEPLKTGNEFDTSIDCYPRPLENNTCEQILCDEINTGNTEFQDMLIEANMRLALNRTYYQEKYQFYKNSNTAKNYILIILSILMAIYTFGRFKNKW
ncbi:MAG: hypothetical protein AABY22_01030 [Nanoarchaeota archaeon]